MFQLNHFPCHMPCLHWNWNFHREQMHTEEEQSESTPSNLEIKPKKVLLESFMIIGLGCWLLTMTDCACDLTGEGLKLKDELGPWTRTVTLKGLSLSQSLLLFLHRP
jgi:hypothetical protein